MKSNECFKRDESFSVPLSSDFFDNLHETSHGDIVHIKKYRPGSVSTVYQYADLPLHPMQLSSHGGRHTKASILGNLQRANSATSIYSTDAWINNNQRLCKIRYYYREPASANSKQAMKTSYMESLQKTSLKGKRNMLNEDSMLQKLDLSDSINSEESKLSVTGTGYSKNDFQTIGVNTEPTYFSLNRWHGAEWQHYLPKMYLPRIKKYDAYKSQPVQTKPVPARFRDASEMYPSGS